MRTAHLLGTGSAVLGGGCGGCIWRLGASEGPSAPEAAQEALSIPRCMKRGVQSMCGPGRRVLYGAQGKWEVKGPGTLSPAESGTMLGSSPSAMPVISGYFK